MRYCKKCGAVVNDDADFCTNCGEKVERYTEVVDNDVVVYGASDIKERSIALAIIFTILTCGLYSIYWMIKINDEALALSGEKGPNGGTVFLLNLITCGIYGYFWSYRMGTCTDIIKGNPHGNSNILYLVIMFLGLGIVNYALTQDAINNKVR